MGKKKSTSQSTATYSYMTPPKSPYLDAAEQYIAGYDGGASGFRESHARNTNAINEASQGRQFFGGNTSPELRDQVRESRLFRNNNELGRNLAGAKQDEIAYKNQAYMGLGGATAPQLVQTGSTGRNEQWGGIMHNFGMNLGGSFGSGLGAAAA